METQRDQLDLMDLYWRDLRRQPHPAPPPTLDPLLARTASELHTYSQPPPPDPLFVAELRTRLIQEARVQKRIPQQRRHLLQRLLDFIQGGRLPLRPALFCAVVALLVFLPLAVLLRVVNERGSIVTLSPVWPARLFGPGDEPSAPLN